MFVIFRHQTIIDVLASELHSCSFYSSTVRALGYDLLAKQTGVSGTKYALSETKKLIYPNPQFLKSDFRMRCYI